GATKLTLSADANTTSNFYVYNSYIPEIQADRTAGLVDTVSGNTASYSVCANSAFTFGTTYNLRIVAADGTMDTSNVSNAATYNYAVALKGAHVLTHTQGDATRAQIGALYDSSCELEATQPTVAGDNNGVSLKTLTTGQVARIAFVPDSGGSNFSRDIAWTTNYDIPSAVGTAVVQIQSTSAYAGDTFIVEYGGNLYSGTFVSTEAAADATTTGGVEENLVLITSDNNTLAP
ncbi:MAG: hypothetical protein OQJ77_06365, partial [Thiovulaceae bacterium]|nr:hypothetical protein [Sulfurimonadaceae bacterium]